MSAAVIQFPRLAAQAPVTPAPVAAKRRSLHQQVNDAAALGYRWGVLDTALYLPVAFIAGLCLAFVVMP